MEVKGVEVNVGNAGYLLELAGFVWNLWRLGQEVEYSVTSWWRTREHNVKVGGSPRSLHLCGLAVDCVPGGNTTKEALLAFAVHLGMYGIVEDDHVHIQARPKRGA